MGGAADPEAPGLVGGGGPATRAPASGLSEVPAFYFYIAPSAKGGVVKMSLTC